VTRVATGSSYICVLAVCFLNNITGLPFTLIDCKHPGVQELDLLLPVGVDLQVAGGVQPDAEDMHSRAGRYVILSPGNR